MTLIRKFALALAAAALIAPLAGFTPAAAAPAAQASTAAVATVLGGPVATAAGSGHVSIPKNYVYNPKAKKNKTLHDYCTKSPDKWGKADFRGPCARHDMCIEGKKVKRSTCDATFLGHLQQECRHSYGKLNPLRYSCLQIAGTYYSVVRTKTFLS